MVPCADMVPFPERTVRTPLPGAIRLARALTGRERVAVCGYHGWQDWYIGSTARHRGVPPGTRDITHGFVHNDAASLESCCSNIRANSRLSSSSR